MKKFDFFFHWFVVLVSVAESPSLPQANVKDVALDVEDVNNKGKKWVKIWVSFLVIFCGMFV